jgi:cold shock protein
MTKSSVTGSVKFFNAAKGFGFIAPEDGGKDVFVPAASIAASGLARLKAGQRVSFDLEPDAKGPKAVKLTVLEDAPVPIHAPIHVPIHAPVYAPTQAEVRQPVAAQSSRATKALSVYIDSANGAADAVLEALEDAGETPRLVELAAATADELKQLSLLLREADQSLVRRYDPLFLALQLDDRFISESDFWTGIVEHPSLVNGPVVAMAGKARICKTAAEVKAFLGGQSHADAKPSKPANGTPANGKPKGISDRMAALMRGESVPPLPAKVTETKAPTPIKAPAKAPALAQPPQVAEPAEPKKPAAPVPVTAPVKAKADAKLIAAAKPVKKAAAKPAQKAKPAPAKANKKK